MSREWGIRRPGEELRFCEWCGEKFASSHGRKKFCCNEHMELWHNKNNPKMQGFVLQGLVRHARTAYENSPYGSPQDKTYAESLDVSVDDPYERLEAAGLSDETGEVVRDLSRGIVWARRAGQGPRRMPFHDLICVIDSALERYERKRVQRKQKPSEWRREQASCDPPVQGRRGSTRVRDERVGGGEGGGDAAVVDGVRGDSRDGEGEKRVSDMSRKWRHAAYMSFEKGKVRVCCVCGKNSPWFTDQPEAQQWYVGHVGLKEKGVRKDEGVG